MKISIITQPKCFISKEKIASILAKLTGKIRGPKAVLESILSGLNEINFEYNLNPKKQIHENVLVLSSHNALKEALELKRRGVIKHLTVGPNVSVLPTDYNSILLDQDIDTLLVPSPWVKDLWLSISPTLSNKIEVWASGTAISKDFSSRKNNFCLIYQKNAPPVLLEQIKQTLEKKAIPHKILLYGHFNRKTYFESLNKSDLVIYLSKSESQGVATLEAWMRDVPTLVWNGKIWKKDQFEWSDNKISAPFLENEAGLFFESNEDLDDKISKITKSEIKFNPRKYALENFTNRTCAEKLLAILFKDEKNS